MGLLESCADPAGHLTGLPTLSQCRFVGMLKSSFNISVVRHFVGKR